jgi:hypothetical protein
LLLEGLWRFLLLAVAIAAGVLSTRLLLLLLRLLLLLLLLPLLQHAKRAKDLLMWVIRTAAVNAPTGTASASGPFGSPFFATYNRASHYGDGFGATYDWLQW